MKCGCCSLLVMKVCQGLYAHVYNNQYRQAIFHYKCIVTSDSSTYISTTSLIVDCFPESMVQLGVQSINGQFITLVSALFTGLILKTMPPFYVYIYVCTL